MGLFAKLFGVVPKEEREGAHLDHTKPHWTLIGPRDFSSLFHALDGWLPDGAILYFEGGSPDSEIWEFLNIHAVPARTHIAIGTIWPRPKIFHVPASKDVLIQLSEVMKNHAAPELAIHFHVFRNEEILLEWHDAFTDPLWISGDISEESVKEFAEKLGTEYEKVVIEQASDD